jgi:hypothetical protein
MVYHLVCLQKTGAGQNTSRLPTREATVPNLLHHALKAACENIPFEMFCPAENNITRHNIKEVCCIRFGFAIASLGMGAGNYLRDRKNRTISKGN